ncbi:MAG: hypothetical protein ABI288_07390 [Ginsengibacter sp.]
MAARKTTQIKSHLESDYFLSKSLFLKNKNVDTELKGVITKVEKLNISEQKQIAKFLMTKLSGTLL